LPRLREAHSRSPWGGPSARYCVGDVEGERLMLQSGGNGKTVSERLGHASTAFTMDVYAASVPALEEEKAAKVAALLD
jgi:integrase